MSVCAQGNGYTGVEVRPGAQYDSVLLSDKTVLEGKEKGSPGSFFRATNGVWSDNWIAFPNRDQVVECTVV